MGIRAGVFLVDGNTVSRQRPSPEHGYRNCELRYLTITVVIPDAAPAHITWARTDDYVIDQFGIFTQVGKRTLNAAGPFTVEGTWTPNETILQQALDLVCQDDPASPEHRILATIPKISITL